MIAGLSSLAAARMCRPSRQNPRAALHQKASRLAEGDASSDARPALSLSDRLRPDSFKKFLREKEAEQPLWYRLSDIYLTCLGAFLFYLEVCEPQVTERYELDKVEDVVNVNFLVRFVLLFWANDFKFSWLWSGAPLLDLLSCLPAVGIPVRFLGGAGMEKAIDIFELARFLRLLRLSLPSNTEGLGRVRDSLQTGTVLLALGGTIVLSATLLFLYENPRLAVLQDNPEHSFEDCVIYMLNIFTNKETNFLAATRSGKQVTAAAIVVGAIFLPFLISGGVQVFMGSGDFLPDQEEMKGQAKEPSAPQAEPSAPQAEPKQAAAAASVPRPTVGYPEQWALVLVHLDIMELRSIILPHEAQELRKRCMAKEEWLLTLDLAYGPAFKGGTDAQAGEMYALRLREWLSSSPEG